MTGQQQPSEWATFNARFGLYIKLGFLLLLIILLLVPLALIDGLVKERKARRNVAVASIARTWGSPQRIVGPVLVIPYRYTVPPKAFVNAKGETRMTRAERRIGSIHVLPESVRMDAALEPSVRYRGIYEAILYTTALKIKGAFRLPDPQTLSIAPGDVLWDQAVFAVGISDLRGARGQTRLAWAGKSYGFKPRTRSPVLGPGLHAPIALSPPAPGSAAPPVAFAFDIRFTGSRRIAFTPVGKTSTVAMVSPWQHPSFDGAYLPTKRSIGAKGFTAEWIVSYLARNYPQTWKSHGEKGQSLNISGLKRGIWGSQFGVSLVTPVDVYLKTERSVKYGILFVLLVLAAIFAFDVAGGLNLHVLQYTLVGFALCVFYLLLLSLAEFAGFLVAYLAAATLATAMIAGYAGKVMGGWTRAGMLAGLVAGVYGFLYVVLQLEDYALLVGSLGVFAALAAVMYGTRNVDWNRLGGGSAKPPE
ncbi:MAG: cell envelope integrity protein CreD [Alphaproteobacteria bacterium]